MKDVKKHSKLKKILIIFVFIIIFLLVYVRYIGTLGLFVKEYAIYTDKLPKSFDGLKIVHFSDIHYGTIISQQNLDDMVKKINELKPDIVFTKFRMRNYNSEDIIKKTFKELRDEKPIFKFVSNDITENTNKTMYKSKTKKMENNEKIKVTRFNYVKELGEKEIVDCLEEYYKEKRNQ